MQGGIRPGYKQTEVGVIPQDWDVARIVDVASITTGSRNTQDRIDTGIYPFFVRSQTVERINSYSFDGEAVLTAGDGVGTGKIFHYINGKFDLHQRVYQISNFSPRLNGFFFYLYFASKFFDRIMSMTAKSSVDSVRREMIADMLMPLPPPDEQRAIATALADADGLIAALERMIAKKRDLKQAAMQHLLTGKTRLPGFSTEWEVKRLGDLCTMRSGEGITAKSIDETSSYPCYGGNGLRGYTTRFTHQGRYALIGRVGALCGNVMLADGKFFASEHAVVVTSFDRVDIGWLAVILGTLGLNRRAESSAQPVLTVSKLLILEVLAPPTKAEQTAIAEVLSDMDADLAALAALEAQANKARAVKQGMMQELLTGRVRLV